MPLHYMRSCSLKRCKSAAPITISARASWREAHAALRAQMSSAAIAQLGERQTEDLKVPGSIPGLGIDSFGHSHICFSIVNILQLLLHPFFLCLSLSLSLSLSPSLLLAYIHVLLFHSFAKLQCALEMQSSGHMV